MCDIATLSRAAVTVPGQQVRLWQEILTRLLVFRENFQKVKV